MKPIKYFLIAILVLTFTAPMHGQEKSYYMPRFAVKTNALYWATTTANLGFEVGLGKAWTLDVSTGNHKRCRPHKDYLDNDDVPGRRRSDC